ncbi:MAG: beta-N-acetylhexosaminidase [Beijerinckiaceae bacterium]|jgi:beta-N-acetylhexosaminidase|nr:beta-N-acetylhexosaminidase [Beijerinckiaceae bacterium]
MNIPARAFILGCAGLELTTDERAFIAREKPWGLILFKRNVADRAQLRQLTNQFRELLGRENAPVLIDQEGGRVQRMGPPHWRAYPPAAAFAAAASKNGADAADLVRMGARLIADDLREAGINVDCLPVLDVPVPGGHQVIGDRAYSDDPALVAQLGLAACEGLLQGGVLPVLKHIPGHGRAGADSHMELPRVDASLEALKENDFIPFKAIADMPLAMSAHVIYEAIDPERPATISPVVVDRIIRGLIGYDGLVMSDDLSMKALSGSFTEKTQHLFAAGLDMALHCSPDLAEAHEVAAASPWLDGKREERAERALKMILQVPEPIDSVDASARLDAALAITT